MMWYHSWIVHIVEYVAVGLSYGWHEVRYVDDASGKKVNGVALWEEFGDFISRPIQR